MLDERLARLAAFERLTALQGRHGDVLPAAVLAAGFEVDGERIHFRSQQGIFKPRQFRLPLSILTSAKNPYGDELGDDGLLRYRYQGNDPQRHDNRWLRECWVEQTELIYFHGVGPGLYRPLWPVFIAGDDPASLTFSVAVDDPADVNPGLAPDVRDTARRQYVTRQAMRRLHQDKFRHQVLIAYRTRCAVCRLGHAELLDAAHILPDRHPQGEPVVPNGLALCKIHHAAYDANVVGIRPDLIVEVNGAVLLERDGPMLRHGLQELHGERLTIPRRPTDQPNPVFLEERYEEFRAAG